jgi:hypothetical protein
MIDQTPKFFDNEIILMQMEWRREMSEQIKDLKALNNELRSQLFDMKQLFVKNEELQLVSKRVESLENDRAKIVGGMFVLQICGTALVWFITKFLNK